MNYKIEIEGEKDGKDNLSACDYERGQLKNYLHVEGEGCRVLCYTGMTSGTPADVWHGRTSRFNLPKVCKISELREWLESEDVSAEIDRILDGFNSQWNGSNYRGSWEDDGEDFQGKIDTEAGSSFAYDYVYEIPDGNYVPEAWGGKTNFIAEYPTAPTDEDSARTLASEILKGNDGTVYCAFGSDALAEDLLERKEEIWESHAPGKNKGERQ